jgi:lysophospholipase L1-like esterase
MRIGLLILGACVVLYWGARFIYLFSVAIRMTSQTVPFERVSDDTSISLLVLGDSTAVGVGAGSPEESVPGRVAAYIGATYVENHAVSGSLVNDVPPQVTKAALPQYRMILLQIGANDIVRFHDADKTATQLGSVLESLPPADSVIVISAGDVGTARIFSPPLRPLHTRVNQQYHAAFANAAQARGVTYIDLSQGPGAELFEKEPHRYFARDRFHLSSDGYGLWFDAIKEVLEKGEPRVP